ncbi:BlaI/MecI/CopY family transcriptional regulator [Candidatus Uhrbacteria bacterium]|nr:BlaI/MecI/CopY family transcriptional regulator [Candidatus Uhrbacteria bacterium]
MSLRGIVERKGKVLGELEELILQALWKLGKGTGREVVAVVTSRRSLAYTTVMTVMLRMVEKGYLCREELQNGRYLYRPCYSREEFYAKTSNALFSQLIRNLGSIAVAQFVDALEKVDPEQMRALERRLQKR